MSPAGWPFERATCDKIPQLLLQCNACLCMSASPGIEKRRGRMHRYRCDSRFRYHTYISAAAALRVRSRRVASCVDSTSQNRWVSSLCMPASNLLVAVMPDKLFGPGRVSPACPLPSKLDVRRLVCVRNLSTCTCVRLKSPPGGPRGQPLRFCFPVGRLTVSPGVCKATENPGL
jgi:hypothetical protein